MPNLFGRDVTVTWSYKVSANENDPGGGDFTAGKPPGPWYAVIDDAADIEDGVEVFFNDAPNLPPYPGDPEDPKHPFGIRILQGAVPLKDLSPQKLFYIHGIDKYEAILLLENDDGEQLAAGSIPWYVIFEAAMIFGAPLPLGAAGTYLNQGTAPGTVVTAGAGSAQRKVASRSTWQSSTANAQMKMLAASRLLF